MRCPTHQLCCGMSEAKYATQLIAKLPEGWYLLPATNAGQEVLQMSVWSPIFLHAVTHNTLIHQLRASCCTGDMLRVQPKGPFNDSFDIVKASTATAL